MDNLRELKEMKGLYEKPEKTKEAIQILISTMKNNKSFSKLINYSVNTLKTFLILSNQIIVIENANTINSNNIIELLDKIVELHKENEEIMIVSFIYKIIFNINF